ncbi:MAG: COG1470 family protein [Usitatibacter sp.]
MACIRHTMRVVSCAALLAVSPVSFAQGFAALISPPRFELAVKPGEKVRDVMEITNASAQAAKYKLRTADWTFAPDASVTFDDALQPGSCRPWVAIESRQITVSPGGKYRYRFEVTAPADAPVGECRFAILIEGDEQQVQTPGGPAFPISGRLGVIVYVTVGAAEPKLEVVATKVAPVNGEDLPVLMVKNTGNAHGRLAGFLSGTDASGKKLEFNTATLPILPGETRAISLSLYREKDEAIKIDYPVTIRGKLEWGSGSTPFEQRFAK